MAGAVIGALRAELSASIAAFQSDLGKAAGSMKAFAVQAKAIGDSMVSVGERMALAITGPLLLLAKASLDQAKELKEAQAQVDAALQSTAGASGKTSKELETLAGKLENISTYDKSEILRGVTASLLQFTNIAGPTFDRAQKAVVDLSARLGGDLQGAAIKVGRALNDPIQGVQALTRMGVQFTTEQKKQIEALVQSGQGYKAQALILDELERKFGGAALAQRQATPTAAFMQAWRNLTEVIGNQLLPVITPLLDKLAEVINRFSALSPEMQQTIIKFAAVAAAVGPIIVVLGSVIGAIGNVAKAFSVVGTALAGIDFAPFIAAAAGVAGPVLAIAAAIAAVGALIWPFRDKIIKAFQDLWDKAVATLGPVFGDLLAALGRAWDQLGATLDALWKGPIGEFLRLLGEGMANLIAWWVKNVGGLMVDVIAGVGTFIARSVDFITDSLKLIVHFLTGEWGKAWEDAQAAATDAMDAINRKAKPGQTPPAPPKPAPQQAPGAPLVPQGSPAAGKGGGGGGFDLHNEDKIKALEQATKDFEAAVHGMDTRISKGLDEVNLPKSIATANALNQQIDDFVKKAKDAGVNTSGWGVQIANLRARIEGLKIAALSKEAKVFGEDVDGAVLAVNRFGNGSLPPLQEKLQAVDDQYKALRDRIQNTIDENKALAGANDDAAAAMKRLQDQLGQLDAAHQKARDAAIAQYQAEQKLADLQSQANQLQTRNQIQDFRAASTGQGGPISSAQEEMQRVGRDLAQTQIDAETKLQQLIAARAEAVRQNDTAQADRLTEEINLQQQLFDLVKGTTAEQIYGQQRINEAFKGFTDGLSSTLTNMVANWSFDLDGLRNVFKQLAQELFIKPFISQGADMFSGFLKGLFSGGFASGGYIPPGRWGIVGEQGAEPAFGGRTGLTVAPGGSQAVTQVFNISTPDANSFRRSQRQIARVAKQRLS